MNKFLIKQSSNIMSAMELINKNGVRTLLVTDNKKSFLGTISDGDIRRAILSKSGALDMQIKDFLEKNTHIHF